MSTTHLDLRRSRRISLAEARVLMSLLESHADDRYAATALAKIREAYAECTRQPTHEEQQLREHRSKLLRERLAKPQLKLVGKSDQEASPFDRATPHNTANALNKARP